MLLGDFDADNFYRSTENLSSSMQTAVRIENFLVTIYFVGMTFFTQITILNMLIAVMGATF